MKLTNRQKVIVATLGAAAVSALPMLAAHAQVDVSATDIKTNVTDPTISAVKVLFFGAGLAVAGLVLLLTAGKGAIRAAKRALAGLFHF